LTIIPDDISAHFMSNVAEISAKKKVCYIMKYTAVCNFGHIQNAYA